MLNTIFFAPDNSVTFRPISTRQTQEFEIKNQGTSDILIKWKSTRPGTFHMLPTYARIRAGESAKTTLICKGISRKECQNSRDRFSIIISAIGDTDLEAREIWKSAESLKQLQIGKLHKKMVFILYEGVENRVWTGIVEKVEQKEMPPTKNSEENENEENASFSEGGAKFQCQLIDLGSEEFALKTAKSGEF